MEDAAMEDPLSKAARVLGTLEYPKFPTIQSVAEWQVGTSDWRESISRANGNLAERMAERIAERMLGKKRKLRELDEQLIQDLGEANRAADAYTRATEASLGEMRVYSDTMRDISDVREHPRYMANIIKLDNAVLKVWKTFARQLGELGKSCQALENAEGEIPSAKLTELCDQIQAVKDLVSPHNQTLAGIAIKIDKVARPESMAQIGRATLGVALPPEYPDLLQPPPEYSGPNSGPAAGPSEQLTSRQRVSRPSTPSPDHRPTRGRQGRSHSP
jgi:hypothetical protein